MTTAEALKELMNKYDVSRTKWIETFGNDYGFDKWFTSQVLEK